MVIFNEISIEPYFQTNKGQAYLTDTIKLLKEIPDESINLIMTSPPFALVRKKSYGNEDEATYIKWFIDNFSYEFKRILKADGSLVIDIGGAYKPKRPVRSLYHFELLTKLCNEVENNGPEFKLAQEFYWYNPSKLPSPIQWVNIDKVRVKDSINPVWWLSKTDNPKANNQNVLVPYKASMKKLLKNGYNSGLRPSQHVVSQTSWQKDNGGAIPPNFINYNTELDLSKYIDEVYQDYLAGFEDYLAKKISDDFSDNVLEIANTSSSDKYLKACKALGLTTHPARFPSDLPEFFIKFLTNENDIVFDPFGGSCVTAEVAERMNRRWITSEIQEDYLQGAQYRFTDLKPSMEKPLRK
ncbi:DNA-methyltransferase [Planococcus ruber]|uniref:DNA-methyltransferase n=1 Tax=Planococcus ruber TaxID=2027871 RepID=UPI001FF0374E|nr:site-specific DNA-methyltransferase [Planococcus ruber]MCJ1909965.1 site-specific DNA-methyltransferase [Planococcus ruber]